MILRLDHYVTPSDTACDIRERGYTKVTSQETNISAKLVHVVIYFINLMKFEIVTKGMTCDAV
jgi:hypothetical protein